MPERPARESPETTWGEQAHESVQEGDLESSGGERMHVSRARTIFLALLISAGTCASFASASPEPGTASPVPESLKPPATQVIALEARASGVQIYECGASKADPTRFEWVFKAPEADLLDADGKKIGKHYAGPTWESNDGSKVIGEVVARDNGPDADSIPWLLLSVKSTSGKGVFSQVLSIQRLSTVGGKAPLGGCDKAQSGKEARVAYKARYTFFAAKP